MIQKIMRIYRKKTRQTNPLTCPLLVLMWGTWIFFAKISQHLLSLKIKFQIIYWLSSKRVWSVILLHYRSDAFMWDQYLIDIDLRILAIWKQFWFKKRTSVPAEAAFFARRLTMLSYFHRTTGYDGSSMHCIVRIWMRWYWQCRIVFDGSSFTNEFL